MGKAEYRVEPRYENFKEEMLEYPAVSPEELESITNKATQYLKTEMCRSLRADTEHHEPITIDDLIGLILYCDYSELSRRFTLSFRKSTAFESLKQIKARNSRYFHWSLTMKDTIKSYGQSWYQGSGPISALRGPFYCGMSIPLNIPQFNMSTHGPTSTSIHIEVATRFSGSKGIIIQMNNSSGLSQWLKGMDVSFISRYKEEDERYVIHYESVYIAIFLIHYTLHHYKQVVLWL